MNNKIPTILFLFLIVFTSCTQNDIDDFVDFNNKANSEFNLTNVIQETTLLDVSYGAHEQQAFDIYLPEGRTTTKTKVLIIIHGGSWVNGDKNSFTDFALQLKENNPNHAIVNINYVLGTEDHFAFPNQFLDIKNIIEFIKYNQSEYRIKPEFGLIGSSSGGHLALQYTYDYDTNNDVKFVASLGGPTDFLDPFYSQQTEALTNFLVDQDHYSSISSVLNNTTTNTINTTDILRSLSPLYNVNRKSSPTLLVHSNQDMIVPISNANILNNFLNEFDIEHSLEIFEGGHGSWNSEDNIVITHSLLNDFIENYLDINL